MPTNSDFRTLLLKIISGDITQEDKALFYNMVLDESQEQELKEVLKELGEERAEFYTGYHFKPEDWTEIKNRILKGETIKDETTPVVVLKDRTIPETLIRKMPVRKLSWIAAAASVVLLIGIGFYLKNAFEQKAEIVVNKPVINDVVPASSKAVLTLSTGQQIVLDSAKKGQLAKFGNTTISKTDSGKLLYSSVGAKAADDETQFNTLTTPRGGIYQLTLPDGTQAWLNAASRIDYPTRFTGKKREVFIEGEVYFEVAHDATHPFLVSLGAKTREQDENGHWMQIEVLGTHFNVNAYEDNKNADPNTAPNLNPTRTTLLEGSIKISAHGENKIIKPGEQAITAFATKTIDVDQNVNVDKVMAWRNGKIAITDVSVQQLMTEISRWYDMDIEYAGAVPEKQFYGSIRRDVPLSTVLHALEAYGVQTKIEGKKIIVQ